ncbi:HNH endonuclease [Haloarcula tailed virus 3]|uniref:HNH endonuclease n=1 Tax=Haloarcula tailed virus 3 TaxID=2877990 RepID=A0AAE8Y083_9CAUD|nr:HNH endonuclease [Haloarcula tailed virus 3]UBF23414.1 HNH endonuclease [Haloarcula tailed virus 3]
MGMSEYRDKADTSRCYFCPKRNDIEVHHIVPQRFNGSDSRENLVALCDRCHRKIEALYDKRFYEKLGVTDETGERSTHFECGMSECSNRARVKAAKQGYEGAWYCLDCVTELYIHWGQYGMVYKDITGKMECRTCWIEAMDENPIKVVRRD